MLDEEGAKDLELARHDVQAEFGIDRKDFGVVYPDMPDDLIKTRSSSSSASPPSARESRRSTEAVRDDSGVEGRP